MSRQLEGIGHGLHQGGPIGSNTVQRARTDERLEHAAIEPLLIHPATQIEHVSKGTVALPLFDQLVYRGTADALDGAQAIAYFTLAGHHEFASRPVDVGTLQVNSELLAVLLQGHELVGVIHVGGQHGSQEMCRVTRLEPCGLVGDQRVCRRMRLVEAVTGEVLHQVEQRRGDMGIDAVGRRTGSEDAALLVHLFAIFLAHGPAEQVGPAHGVTRDGPGNLHHLLLIQDDAVGRFQNRLEARVKIVHRSRVGAVLAVDEGVHHPGLQGAGTEQCQHGHQVAEAVGLQAPDQIAHPPGLQLKDTRRLATPQQFIRFRIVHGNLRRTQGIEPVFLPLPIDGLESAIDDGQGPQAQKVELHQSYRLDIVLVQLAQRTPFRLDVQRHELRQGTGSNYDTAGMSACVAGNPFELPGQVNEFPHLGIILVESVQFFVLERLLQGDSQFERDQFGDLVHKSIGQPQGAADIPNNGLGGHGAEGDDLRDPIRPVAIGDVGDHIVATVDAEIDIEIGHGDAFGIEEPLEQQIVFQRIEVGDAKGKRNQRARSGTAARAYGNLPPPRPTAEVRDDQEVALEAHLADDFQFAVQSLPVGRKRDLAVSVRRHSALRKAAK